jgi:hypothetical protein
MISPKIVDLLKKIQTSRLDAEEEKKHADYYKEQLSAVTRAAESADRKVTQHESEIHAYLASLAELLAEKPEPDSTHK